MNTFLLILACTLFFVLGMMFGVYFANRKPNNKGYSVFRNGKWNKPTDAFVKTITDLEENLKRKN